MSIYVGDKEIKNLYAGGSISVSDMQGPAPDGFHVPLVTEWQGLKTIMASLSLATPNGWKINLHIPFAGYRKSSSAGLSSQGSEGYYWSSSPYGSGDSDRAYSCYIPSNIIYTTYQLYRAYGFSVRCFKDSYVTPDSNWTVIQGTLGSAGIFWNQSEGLISITNGTTGYTIMDKNLGATTVYNDGDTLSEANCGKYYQWGNNYGFAWTGNVTTSSTQVDTSVYGPGNYYSSSTFITRSSSPYDWSSVQNDNLRGGISQGSSIEALTAKEIYLGDVKVWPGLLAYEEIVTMANAEGYPYTNTLAELNAHAQEYANYGDISLDSNPENANAPHFYFDGWYDWHYTSGGGSN